MALNSNALSILPCLLPIFSIVPIGAERRMGEILVGKVRKWKFQTELGGGWSRSFVWSSTTRPFGCLREEGRPSHHCSAYQTDSAGLIERMAPALTLCMGLRVDNSNFLPSLPTLEHGRACTYNVEDARDATP